MDPFVEKILKFRWLIIILVALITIYFGYCLTGIKVNSNILSSLPADDPVASLYLELGDEFGGNDLGMLVIESDNIFTADMLQIIKQVTDSIKYTPGVATVTSLTNVMNIKSSEWGIEVRPLIDEYELPEDPDEIDSLRTYIMSKEMYNGVLVSKDGSATVVMFTLLHESDPKEVVAQIRKRVGSLELKETLYYGGVPVMMDDINGLILNDIKKLIPIVFLVISLVLFLSFRSLRGIILPLTTAGIAVVWTMGLMTATGYELTIITNTIPVVLLAVGSAYSIHILNSIEQHKPILQRKTLVKAVGIMVIPVILASATTMVGFLSFVFGAYLTMIQDFGIFTAVGTFFALLLSIFFIPSIVAVGFMSSYKKNPSPSATVKSSSRPKTILLPMVKSLIKHPKKVFLIWMVVLAICIGGIFNIKTNANMTHYFKEHFPTRVAENILQQKFGGSMPVFVLFEGDMQDPEVLKMMMKTEAFMKEDPDITFTQSIAGLVEQLNDAMGEGKQIPDEKEKIEQLWFLIDGQDIMSQIVSDDLDRGIILSRFSSIDSREIERFTSGMDQFIKKHSTDECAISFTGMPSVYMQLNSSLIMSQFTSLLIAIIMVLIIVSLILRSLPLGLYATIPVLATIIILFGFMGITSIPLDIATVLVASVALGIGIDYAIHIISGFKNHWKVNGDVEAALVHVVTTSGKAVMINVFSVAAGFLLLLFSQIVPLQHFGLLVAVSMIGSGLGALTLLPVILIIANRKKKISNYSSTKNNTSS